MSARRLYEHASERVAPANWTEAQCEAAAIEAINGLRANVFAMAEKQDDALDLVRKAMAAMARERTYENTIANLRAQVRNLQAKLARRAGDGE